MSNINEIEKRQKKLEQFQALAPVDKIKVFWGTAKTMVKSEVKAGYEKYPKLYRTAAGVALAAAAATAGYAAGHKDGAIEDSFKYVDEVDYSSNKTDETILTKLAGGPTSIAYDEFLAQQGLRYEVVADETVKAEPNMTREELVNYMDSNKKNIDKPEFISKLREEFTHKVSGENPLNPFAPEEVDIEGYGEALANLVYKYGFSSIELYDLLSEEEIADMNAQLDTLLSAQNKTR